MRTVTRSKAVAALAAGLMVTGGGIAAADDISNDLDATVDAVAEVMALNVGGANGTTQLYVTPRNGDGKNGCNLTSSTSLGLDIASSNTSVATVTPSAVTFTSCGDTKLLTVTPVAQGSATISVSQTSNNTGATFSLAPATFTVNVAPPANTAPTISVTGVTGGASYAKGSVPTANCQVTDAEDGNSTFAATLSAVTGPYASEGVGSQTASCEYTDGGGLKVSASETYSITDASAPVIGSAVTGTLGDNGWYVSNVNVDWTVTDAQSEIASTTGCDDLSITTDQNSTTYTCSATSAGGTASDSVTIKRDATAPVVNPGDVINTTWRNTSLAQSFTASDATSGLASSAADASFTLTASDESVDASTPTVASRTVKDNAGNTTTRTLSAKIDTTAPTVSYTSASGTPGTGGWYTSAVTATFTGTDALSGPASATKTETSTGEGSAVGVQSPAFTDNAGNTTGAGAASQSFKIDLNDPTAAFVGGPADDASYHFGSVPAAPTCNASDTATGSGAASCVVTGYSAAVGAHTLTATATDNAGRTGTATVDYEVLAWTLKGFYSPVDMGGVWNTVKGGSTVPLKFEVFAGTELTNTSAVQSFATKSVTCPGASAPADEIEFLTTGGTSLRYDATAGQFIQNWATPKKPGTCHVVTMTTQDGSKVSANFILK